MKLKSTNGLSLSLPANNSARRLWYHLLWKGQKLGRWRPATPWQRSPPFQIQRLPFLVRGWASLSSPTPCFNCIIFPWTKRRQNSCEWRTYVMVLCLYFFWWSSMRLCWQHVILLYFLIARSMKWFGRWLVFFTQTEMESRITKLWEAWQIWRVSAKSCGTTKHISKPLTRPRKCHAGVFSAAGSTNCIFLWRFQSEDCERECSAKYRKLHVRATRPDTTGCHRVHVQPCHM